MASTSDQIKTTKFIYLRSNNNVVQIRISIVTLCSSMQLEPGESGS